MQTANHPTFVDKPSFETLSALSHLLSFPKYRTSCVLFSALNVAPNVKSYIVCICGPDQEEKKTGSEQHR